MIFRKKLGEILIEAELLTKEILDKALVEQKKGGVKLGKYLIQQNIVKENQIVDVLSQQLKIARYSPNQFPLDLNLATLIPYDAAVKHQVVPLKKKGRLLTVAMSDPLDIYAMDTIEVQTNLEVEPVVCTEHELNQIIDGIYGIQSAHGDFMEGIALNIEPTGEKTAEDFTEDVQVRALQEMAGETPVIRIVNSLFAQAIREKASDVHISPQKQDVQLRYRIDGKLIEMPAPPKSMFLPLVARIKILANMDITISRIPQDGRFTLKTEGREINIRVSSMPTIYGENIVLRFLDMSGVIMTLEQLGMQEEDRAKIETMVDKPYGMILSTGPTGSGKSTSLYSILGKINKPDINIITVEDPVEYRINSIRQVQLNKKAGMTFASGLRSILRQDPDVIMVGEIRDSETAGIAVQAAQTGHRVLSTVHTNDAAGAVTRFIDMGIEPFLVASVLLVSFAQRLIRTNCPYCSEPYRPPERALTAWGLDKVKDANFMHGKGCYKCMNTGYRGRTGIFEVLVNDEMMQEMILQKRSAQEITRQAVAAGKLKTLREDAAMKVIKGITTLEEAESAVMT